MLHHPETPIPSFFESFPDAPQGSLVIYELKDDSGSMFSSGNLGLYLTVSGAKAAAERKIAEWWEFVQKEQYEPNDFVRPMTTGPLEWHEEQQFADGSRRRLPIQAMQLRAQYDPEYSLVIRPRLVLP